MPRAKRHYNSGYAWHVPMIERVIATKYGWTGIQEMEIAIHAQMGKKSIKARNPFGRVLEV